MKPFLRFLAVFVLLAACEGEEQPDEAADAAFMPLQKGNYWIYAVREKQYSAGAQPQNAEYEVMMQVIDSFPSSTGLFTYVIQRSEKAVDGDVWEPRDTWSARSDGREVIVSEANISYVKLRFPVKPAVRWDGNALNGGQEDEYGYTSVGMPMELNGLHFSETATVEQERNEDAIVFKDVRREVYARGAGLVLKEIVQHHYCTDDACLGQQKIEQGIELTMVIKEYGN